MPAPGAGLGLGDLLDRYLHPFADELSAGTDWIHFGRFADPSQDVKRIAQD